MEDLSVPRQQIPRACGIYQKMDLTSPVGAQVDETEQELHRNPRRPVDKMSLDAERE